MSYGALIVTPPRARTLHKLQENFERLVELSFYTKDSEKGKSHLRSLNKLGAAEAKFQLCILPLPSQQTVELVPTRLARSELPHLEELSGGAKSLIPKAAQPSSLRRRGPG